MANCNECKKEFEKKRHNQIYCTLNCTRVARNNRSKIRHREKVNYIFVKTKICPICGIEFDIKVHNNIYCSFKCRSKFHNAKPEAKERDKRYRTSEKYKKRIKEYHKSNSYKETVEKTKLHSQYKERRKRICKKYNDSVKGRINSIKYDNKRKHNLSRIKHTFTIKEFEKKLEGTKGICCKCNKFVGLKKLTTDHIIPISKAKIGLEYTINDIQFMCKSCNSKKGTKNEYR